jgi:hypothetical protein
MLKSDSTDCCCATGARLGLAEPSLRREARVSSRPAGLLTAACSESVRSGAPTGVSTVADVAARCSRARRSRRRCRLPGLALRLAPEAGPAWPAPVAPSAAAGSAAGLPPHVPLRFLFLLVLLSRPPLWAATSPAMARSAALPPPRAPLRFLFFLALATVLRGRICPSTLEPRLRDSSEPQWEPPASRSPSESEGLTEDAVAEGVSSCLRHRGQNLAWPRRSPVVDAGCWRPCPPPWWCHGRRQ